MKIYSNLNKNILDAVDSGIKLNPAKGKSAIIGGGDGHLCCFLSVDKTSSTLNASLE